MPQQLATCGKAARFRGVAKGKASVAERERGREGREVQREREGERAEELVERIDMAPIRRPGGRSVPEHRVI